MTRFWFFGYKSRTKPKKLKIFAFPECLYMSWPGTSKKIFSFRWFGDQICCLTPTPCLNRAWERNWYIMSPMKNPKRWFFALNMKFSMCRDYTNFFSKIAPCAKGENKYANIQVIRTIILKISKLASKLEIFKIIVRITCIFAYFFSPFAHGAILEIFFV